MQVGSAAVGREAVAAAAAALQEGVAAYFVMSDLQVRVYNDVRFKSWDHLYTGHNYVDFSVSSMQMILCPTYKALSKQSII